MLPIMQQLLASIMTYIFVILVEMTKLFLITLSANQNHLKIGML